MAAVRHRVPAPRFDAAGAKTANARFKSITLNGEQIHKDVEMKQQTPGGVKGKESAAGPLMFQGDHGAVAYRSIKVTEERPLGSSNPRIPWQTR